MYRQAIWGHIWKLTLEKKRTNATNATLHLFGQTIWGDIWKSIQMQPMRLCICTGRQFETHLKTHSGEKADKCNQCHFASVRADNLRRQLKKKNVWMQPFATLHLFRQAIWVNIWKLPQVKNCSNAINATMHLYRQAIWGHIWKLTLEKKDTNATDGTLHLFRQKTWGHIWKVTWEKHTNAINATLHLFRQTIWGDSWKKRTNATICNFASIHAGDLRKHLKTPSGEKSFKCNQCDFPSVRADNLRRQLKKAYKCNHLRLSIYSDRRF